MPTDLFIGGCIALRTSHNYAKIHGDVRTGNAFFRMMPSIKKLLFNGDVHNFVGFSIQKDLEFSNVSES